MRELADTEEKLVSGGHTLTADGSSDLFVGLRKLFVSSSTDGDANASTHSPSLTLTLTQFFDAGRTNEDC
jgi:hypothetical protein